MIAETRKSKIQPVRVPSDDCTIMVGRIVRDGAIVVEGTPYRVHEGEWVDIIPVQSMREGLALAALVSMGADTETDQERNRAIASHVGGPLTAICEELSRRVVAWSWTDNDGEVLPVPYRAPEVIQGLSNDELLWLLTAAQGETGAQRKNGSTP